ncbi:MAG: YlxR family protein [Mogibacterium sp.]|nr:YlxR family protein [Mogibacterium sp.]
MRSWKLRRHKTPKPMRRCIACRESKPQDELIRFTFDGKSLSADTDTKRDGRGFYLCNNEDCLETAIKRKAFNRVCRQNVDGGEIRKVFGIAAGNDQGGIDVKES